MATRTTTTAVAAILVVAALAGGLAGPVAAGGDAHGADARAGAAVAQGCSFPVEVTDATGETVRIEEEPERVVTTSPSAAQTMKEIGAWEKVVGVSQYAEYLEGSEEKANVSGPGGASVERVVAQRPDLVLVPNATFGNLVPALREAGLTVYHFRKAESIEDIEEKTLLTGELVGACEGAGETVDWMEAEMEPVRQAVAGQDRPRVLYVLDPEYGVTVGEDTFIHDVMEAAGGDNVAANAGIGGYAVISPEVVAERDPEWLVVSGDSPSVPETDAYNGTTAVREDNVVVVDANHLNQPAPRVVYAVQTMAEAFHPEAYEAAVGTPTATDEPTDTPGATPTPSPADEGSPGFGLSVAVVALLAAAAFRLRYR